MRHVRRTFVTSLLAFSVALAGCIETGGGGGGAAFDEDVRSLERGRDATTDGKETVVVEDDDQWQEWWLTLRGSCLPESECPPPPEVDFTEERVVVVVLGPSANSCYGVGIEGVRTDPAAGVTVVRYVERRPGPEDYCAEVIVNPWHAVAVAKRGTRVEFEENGGGPPDGEEAAPRTLALRELSRDGACDGERREYLVVVDRSEWESVWSRIARCHDPEPALPVVDFDRERVLAVFMGEFGSSGYAIRVTGANLTAGKVVADVELRGPEPGGGLLTVMTYPFHAVAIPDGDEPVEFRETKRDVE